MAAYSHWTNRRPVVGKSFDTQGKTTKPLVCVRCGGWPSPYGEGKQRLCEACWKADQAQGAAES